MHIKENSLLKSGADTFVSKSKSKLKELKYALFDLLSIPVYEEERWEIWDYTPVSKLHKTRDESGNVIWFKFWKRRYRRETPKSIKQRNQMNKAHDEKAANMESFNSEVLFKPFTI